MYTEEDIKNIAKSNTQYQSRPVSLPKIELSPDDIGRLARGKAPIGYQAPMPNGTVIEAPRLPAPTNIKPKPEAVRLPEIDRGAAANSGIGDRIYNFAKGANPITTLFSTANNLFNMDVQRLQEQNKLAQAPTAPVDAKGILSGKALAPISTPYPLGMAAFNADVDKLDPSSRWKITEALEKSAAEGKEAFKAGMGNTGRFLADTAFAGTDLLAKAGASALTGVPFLALSGVTSGAQAGQEAIDAGYDAGKVGAMALGSGAITAGIESLGGIGGNVGGKLLSKLGGSAAGKAVISKLPAKAVDYIAKLSATKAGEILGNAAAEGGEEFAEYFAQTALKRMVLDTDTPYDVKEALLGALSGGIIGGLFGGGKALLRGQGEVTAENVATIADTPAQNEVEVKTPVTVGANTEDSVVGNANGQVTETPIVEPARSVVDDVSQNTQNPPKMNVKAQETQSYHENRLLKYMSKAMGYQGQELRSDLKQQMRSISQDVLATGEIPAEKANTLFNQMLDAGRVKLDAEYQNSKPVRDYLRQHPILLSNDLKGDVADMSDLIKKNFGRINFTADPKKGLHIDRIYNDILGEYPWMMSVLKADASPGSAQLGALLKYLDDTRKMELSLEEYAKYTGGDYSREVEYLRKSFDKQMEQFAESSRKVGRYIQDADRQKNFEDVSAEISDGDAVAMGQTLESYRRELAKLERRSMLTQQDRSIVDRIVKGEIGLDAVQGHINYDQIEAMAKIKQQIKPIEDMLTERRRAINSKLDQQTQALIDQGSMEKWDSPKGTLGLDLLRPTDVFERLTKKLPNNQQIAKQLNDALLHPVNKATADKVRRMNELIQPIAAMEKEYKISKEESIAAYMVADKVPIVEIAEKVKIDPDRLDVVEKLAKTIKEKLGELLPEQNKVLVENGYLAKQGREDYMTHYFKPQADDLMGKLTELMGGTPGNSLPTDIAGRTGDFKPGRAFNQFLQERSGGEVDYNIGILEAYQRYINSATDTIYYTKPIRTIRSFANNIRKQYSSEGVRRQIDAIRNNIDYSPADVDAQIAALQGLDAGHQGALVQWLDNYADLLANKKSMSDRWVEAKFGRSYYQFASAIENRVAANMIAGNIRSALTNFAPIAQGVAEINPKYLKQAYMDMRYDRTHGDGFVSRSDFLTSRRGAEKVGVYGVDKAEQILSKPFEFVDDFVSELMARAGSYQFGSEIEGNRWAASLIGDRSKGALPMIFHDKNPLTKLLTTFQVEANNQYHHMGKAARRMWEQSPQKLAQYMFAQAMSAFMFNELFKLLVGGEGPIPDIIGPLAELGQDIANPNIGTAKTITNLGQNVLEDVPFIGGLMGGGRLPVSAALPSLPKLTNAVGGIVDGTKAPEKAWSEIKQEAAKPLMYLALPFGGGQIKKSIEGANTLVKGGEYALNNKGEKQLKYLPGNAWDQIKLPVFGKSSTSTADEYWQNGGTPLTPKETSAVDKGVGQQIDRKVSFKVISELKRLDTMSEKRRYLMDNKELTPNQKWWLDRQLFDLNGIRDYSSEAHFELSNIGESVLLKSRSHERMGMDVKDYLAVYKATRKLEADKDPKTGNSIPLSLSRKKKEAIDKAVPANLPANIRRALYEEFGVSESLYK